MFPFVIVKRKTLDRIMELSTEIAGKGEQLNESAKQFASVNREAVGCFDTIVKALEVNDKARGTDTADLRKILKELSDKLYKLSIKFEIEDLGVGTLTKEEK